jgi:hypothetical protein
VLRWALTVALALTSLVNACDADLSNWVGERECQPSSDDSIREGVGLLTWFRVCRANCGLM